MPQIVNIQSTCQFNELQTKPRPFVFPFLFLVFPGPGFLATDRQHTEHQPVCEPPDEPGHFHSPFPVPNPPFQIVNIQSTSQFASHQMNRDTWRDEMVRALVENNFVLFQVPTALRLTRLPKGQLMA